MRPGGSVCSRRPAGKILRFAGQQAFFDTPQPRYVEVDLSGVVVEGSGQFGGPWLALQFIGKLGLKANWTS